MKSSEICAASTNTSKRKKKIIFGLLLRTHPPNARDRLLESVVLVHPTPEHENFSLRRSANLTGKRRLLLTYRLSGRVLGQLVLLRNSGPKAGSIRWLPARRKRSPARGFPPPRPQPGSFHRRPIEQPRCCCSQ